MKALPVHESAFTVLRIFDCRPGESEQFAHQLADFIASATRLHGGFLSSLVYLSDDARKVVELHQWARAEDWEAFRKSDDGRRAVELEIGRIPSIQFLEMVRATGAPSPGDSGVRRGIDVPEAS
jgi:heme-degrading monooxygenase HmoA